jgi:hypothetical protein
MFLDTTFYWVHPQLNFEVGECISIGDQDYVYKITQIGKYGLKTITPVMLGYEEFLVNQQNLKSAMKMDCFDLFK